MAEQHRPHRRGDLRAKLGGRLDQQCDGLGVDVVVAAAAERDEPVGRHVRQARDGGVADRVDVGEPVDVDGAAGEELERARLVGVDDVVDLVAGDRDDGDAVRGEVVGERAEGVERGDGRGGAVEDVAGDQDRVDVVALRDRGDLREDACLVGDAVVAVEEAGAEVEVPGREEARHAAALAPGAGVSVTVMSSTLMPHPSRSSASRITFLTSAGSPPSPSPSGSHVGTRSSAWTLT
jgi:hypothetical protein